MAISTNTRWLTEDGSSYRTQDNVVLVANAVDIPCGTSTTGEYNDTAQYIGGKNFAFSGNTMTTSDNALSYRFSDAFTIALTGDTVNLEVGGDYSNRNDDLANVRFVGDGGNVRSAQTVYFTDNGILHLTAQNGARTADVDSGFSDDNILLAMNGTMMTGYRKGTDGWYSDFSNTDIYLAVVRAAKTLNVASDLAGTFLVDGASLIGRDREAGTAAGVYAIQANQITIDGNYRANAKILYSTAAICDTTAYDIKGAYLRLNGINSAADFSSNKEWVNNVEIIDNTVAIDLDGYASSAKTSDVDPFNDPRIDNNQVTVSAVEVSRNSGTNLSLNAIGFAGGEGNWENYPATFLVEGNDPTLRAYGFQDVNAVDAAPTAHVMGNTIATMALNANTITLGDVAENASFSVDGGTTTLKSEISNGRLLLETKVQTSGGTALVSKNVVDVAGLRADVITLDSFAGTISVAGGSLNVVTWNRNWGYVPKKDDKGQVVVGEGTFTCEGESNGEDKRSANGNTLWVAGIYADDRMTVSSYFGGDIVVTRGTATWCDGESVTGEISGQAVGELPDAEVSSGTVSGGTFSGSLNKCTIVGKITDGTVNNEEKELSWEGTFGGTITDIPSTEMVIVNGTIISVEGETITDGEVQGGTIVGGTIVEGEISGTAESGLVGRITETGITDYAFGILTPYLEDSGRIAVNISSGDGNLLDACIKAGTVTDTNGVRTGQVISAGTVCTDAITGSLTGAVIGIDVRDAFVSPYYRVSSTDAAADSIDITGFIGGSGMEYAIKVGSALNQGDTTTNCSIRVSGVIAVDADNYAIATEYYTPPEDENQDYGEYTQEYAQDDVVELAANAVVDQDKLGDVIALIVEGGTVYASGDSGEITVDGSLAQSYGTITGGTITGKIRLGSSTLTGSNWAIINTQSVLGTTDSKFHFVGNEGLLNLSFQLDGKAQERATYLTDFDDASMTSTTSIGINCDYAKSGETYKLIEYGNMTADEDWKQRSEEDKRDVSGAEIAAKWTKRKVTCVWRGEEGVFKNDDADGGVFNPQNGAATVTFKDGTTATLEMVADDETGTSTLQVTVNKSDSASKLATLDIDLVEESWDAATNRYTIDWSTAAGSWSTTMAKLGFYELEYSINGGNTIVTRLNKDQTSLSIDQVLDEDIILWRIRGVNIDLKNAGYYVGETNWSRYRGAQCDAAALEWKLDMSSSFADASGQYTRDGARINGAAAMVYWDPAVVKNTTLDHYIVEYVESLDWKNDDEAEAMFDAGEGVITKQTSDTSVMLTSLTTRCYVYWRIKAVDVYGNESAYKMGEGFRVFDGDETAPVFSDSNIDVAYAKGTDDTVNITVNWAHATDVGSGVKYYKVTLTDESGASQSQTVKHIGNIDYGILFSGVDKQKYTVTVTAIDYSKNYTTIQAPASLPPTLNEESFTVNYTKLDSNYVTLKVSWDPAVSASGIAIDRYVVTVKQGDVTVCQQTVSDKTSTTFNNRDFAIGEYTVTIQAYDLAQNASDVVEKYRICGGLDLEGEWGTITTEPTITATGGTTWVDDGYTHFDSTTKEVTSGHYETRITSASAVFTWTDTFSHANGFRFALDFSDTKDFSGQVFTYYTEKSDIYYEGGTRTVTLDQDAAHPISILAQLAGGKADKKIYWRVRAGGMDDSEFVSNMTSGVNSFYFTSDGTAITHQQSPAKADVAVSQTQVGGGTTAQVFDGKLSVTVSTEKADLGITKYEVTLKNKSNSAYSYTWTVDYNSDLIAATTETSNSFTKVFDLTTIFGNVNYDGTYSITVKTYNASGTSTSTSSVVVDGSTVSSFAVDTIAPAKVTDVTLQTFAASVLVNWSASSDASGIQKYIVKGRVSGSSVWQDMISVDASATSAVVSGLSDNTYQFAVCAVDKNGNISEFSEQPSINVYVETDYEDNYIPDKWVTFSDTKFSVSNSIGSSDKADYFCIACDVSCTMSIDLAGLINESGKSSGIKIALYKYDGTGKEKAIKTFSVKSAKSLLTDYALEAGEYFVKITANKATAIDSYALNFTKSNFSTAALNNHGDNNWATLDESTFAPISTNAKVVDWVGYGDDIDYRRVSFDVSGNYSLNLKTSGDPATLTLYEQNGATLTAVKSISTSAASDYNTMMVLLDNQKTYYIGTTAAGSATLKNSNYTASLTLNQAYDGDKVSHNDDTAALAAANYPALSMENNMIQEWVGFGDSIDYRKLDLAHGGNYNLRLSGVTHTVKFTLYQELAGQLVTVQSLTIDPAEGRSATGKIGNVWLDSSANATYFVSVEAVNAAQEKNSNYLLNLSAYTVYSDGAHNDDDTAADAAKKQKYHLALNDTVSNEWVGFGDDIDYRKIDIAYSGEYKFAISGVENQVTLSVWQKSGDSQVLVNSMTVDSGSATLTQLLDVSENYYVSVNCVNCDAAHNSYYGLAMTGIEYPEAKTGDDWSDLASLGAASAEYGSFGTLQAITDGKDQKLVRQDNVTGEKGTSQNWVSFGDTVDYVKFTINSAAHLTFNITATGSVIADMTINHLEESTAGYYLNELGGVKACYSTGTTDLWLEKGTYYIAVEAENADQGGNGHYEISLGANSVFYPKSNTGNTDASWQEAAQHQTESWQVTRSGSTKEDWIGFGNTADYWRVQLAEDGKLQIALEGDTWQAYQAGKIGLDLVDGNGNAIIWTQSDNLFTSTTEITGGNPCYFGVICKDNKTDPSIDYKATLSLIAIK